MKKLFVIFLLAIATSCAGDKTSDLQKLYGLQITEPTSALHKIARRNSEIKDTLIYTFQDNSHMKILAYYNSLGCTPCRLKELSLWNKQMEAAQLDSLKVRFVFVFNAGTKISDLELSLRLHRFTHPVMIDTKGEFEMQNLLPEDERFHYFLLDKDNKIVLVGSPLGNPAMWELYKKKISEDS